MKFNPSYPNVTSVRLHVANFSVYIWFLLHPKNIFLYNVRTHTSHFPCKYMSRRNELESNSLQRGLHFKDLILISNRQYSQKDWKLAVSNESFKDSIPYTTSFFSPFFSRVTWKSTCFNAQFYLVERIWYLCRFIKKVIWLHFIFKLIAFKLRTKKILQTQIIKINHFSSLLSSSNHHHKLYDNRALS